MQNTFFLTLKFLKIIIDSLKKKIGLSKWCSGKESTLPMQETQEMQVWSLGQKDPLEKEKVTHSSILAWKIPWTEEPSGLLWGHKELDMTEQIST